jgi:hypothetical protein
MNPQRNIIESANEIVKEQTNMGAVARIGINAINSRYKSTAGLNTPEDRIRNAHSQDHRPRKWDATGTPTPQMRIDTLLQKIRDRTVEVSTPPKVNGKPIDVEYYGLQDLRKRRKYGDEIEWLLKTDRNKNVS